MATKSIARHPSSFLDSEEGEKARQGCKYPGMLLPAAVWGWQGCATRLEHRHLSHTSLLAGRSGGRSGAKLPPRVLHGVTALLGCPAAISTFSFGTSVGIKLPYSLASRAGGARRTKYFIPSVP